MREPYMGSYIYSTIERVGAHQTAKHEWIVQNFPDLK